jgi:3-hydroxyacyl-[acyl-carrier-protein] dehydratase
MRSRASGAACPHASKRSRPDARERILPKARARTRGSASRSASLPKATSLLAWIRYATRMDPVALGLPHREPFIFVESVEKLEAGLLAECSKTFRRNEACFKGHFPGNAIVPGVLLIEGMAQTAGIAVGGPGKMFLLTAIRSMKFLRPVRPDETIGFKARKVGDTAGLVQCTVEARVGQDLVAEGQIILANVSLSK